MIYMRIWIKIVSAIFIANYIVPLVCANAFAAAPYEDEIERLDILYKNGSSISLLCKNDNCDLQIKKDGVSHKFSSKEMGGVPAYPSGFRPVLFSVDNIDGQFSFEVQLDCKFGGFPKDTKWPCFGNYLVVDGRLEKIHKYVLKNGVVTPLSKF